ncbi:MAG: OB-fold domain-containing protein [Christensenellales bacterium]
MTRRTRWPAPSPTRTRARAANISELSEAVMIDFIEGTVESKAPGELVICAGGVGFLLMCSKQRWRKRPRRAKNGAATRC